MGIRSNTAFRNFSAGKIGKKLCAQFDLPIYNNACEDMDNFIPYLQGPARFREGTKFVRESSEIATLIPFTFSDEQSYMLEFSHRRFRVFKDGAIVQDPDGVGPITNAIDHPTVINTCQITLTGHGLSDWDEVVIEGMNNTVLNGTWYIRVEDANTFRVNKKFLDAFIASPNSKVYKLASFLSPYRAYDDGNPDTTTPSNIGELEKPSSAGAPFDAPEFLEMQYAQAFDTMYIVHKNCAPRKLVRSGELSWAISTFTRTSDPFNASNKYPSAITFHEQRLVYGKPQNEPMKVLASKAGSFADHSGTTNATDAWVFQAGTRRTLNSVLVLIGNEEFLMVGGSEGPDRMFGSGDQAITPTNVNIKPLDNYGVANVMPTLVGKDIVYVQKDLKRIRSIQYDSQNGGGFVPVDLTKTSDEILNGKVWQIAYQTGEPNVLWIVLRDGGLVGLNYDSQEQILGWHPHSSRAGDKFQSVAVRPIKNGYDEVWFKTERVINGETKWFIEVMDQPKTYPRREEYFTGDEDADLAAFQNDMAEAIKAAYHLDCGGTYDGFDQLDEVELAALTGAAVVFSNPNAGCFRNTDVGRYILQKGGPGRAKITGFTDFFTVTCKILADFEIEADENGDYILDKGDWALTATTVTDLDHLEGETVYVVADGAVVGEKTVESGAVTGITASSVIHVGLKYRGRLKTVNIESGGVNGPAQTKTKNVHQIGFKFIDTLGAKFGTDPYKLEEIPFRDDMSQIGRPPPLFTGEKVVPVSDESATEKHVYVHQDQPLPCTVQAIVPYLSTGVG